jgi:hypothetical protein
VLDPVARELRAGSEEPVDEQHPGRVVFKHAESFRTNCCCSEIVSLAAATGSAKMRLPAWPLPHPAARGPIVFAYEGSDLAKLAIAVSRMPSASRRDAVAWAIARAWLSSGRELWVA